MSRAGSYIPGWRDGSAFCLPDALLHVAICFTLPNSYNAMPYKFELKKDKAGKTRFNFIAPNGQVMFSSQAYESRSSAVKTIESIKKNTPGADIVDAES